MNRRDFLKRTTAALMATTAPIAAVMTATKSVPDSTDVRLVKFVPQQEWTLTVEWEDIE